MASERGILDTDGQQSPEIPSNVKNADGAEFETTGYVSPRAAENRQIEGANTSRAAVVASIRSRLKHQLGTMAVQLRSELSHASEPAGRDAKMHVDELYWESQLSQSSFVFIGRKRIVNGVALGRNPTDFFNVAKPEDRTLVDEDRRSEKEGDDLLGWSYFGRAYSIHTAIASAAQGGHRNRAVLQLAGNVDALLTDFSIIGYYADIPGIGLNLSTVIGDKTTAYMELSVRKGRDRQRPVWNEQKTAIGIEEDANRWFPDLVVGGQYTSRLGPTFTVEYWRNANGYSNFEHASIVHSLLHGQGRNPLTGRLLGTPNLRQKKIFFRVSDIKMTEGVHLEAAAIYSLDDASKFIRSAITWDITNADSLRVGVDRFVGNKLSEYGANPADLRLFLVCKRLF